MGKPRLLEAEQILKVISKDQLMAIHKIRGDKDFKHIVSMLNGIAVLDKDKIVGLVSDVLSTDDAVKKTSKQNFYRGRINLWVLLHSLFLGAEKELEKRERKNG